MMWGAIIAAFLVGAATGGWWSRRRAVAVAFQAGHAVGEAAAFAYAAGGSVVFNGWGGNAPRSHDHDGARDYDYDYDHECSGVPRPVRRDPVELARLDAAGLGPFDGGAMGDSRPALVERPDGTVN